jgi:RNA polymerase sigma-70 factor (ECF subfamily)
LRQIYEAEAARMLGVALRLLRRRALAEEAVHDAFVQIWRKAASFDPARGQARSWLYAILRHRALNIRRDEDRIELASST